MFLCPTEAERVSAAQRIAGYGRMRHEAAAVDPGTLIAYLTEDRERRLLLPLRARRSPSIRSRASCRRCASSIDPASTPARCGPASGSRSTGSTSTAPLPEDDSLRYAAQAKGAARFARSEGLWLTAREAYFCATSGGAYGRGQMLRLGLRAGRARSSSSPSRPDADVLDMPDNLCVSPHGELYVAEDGGGGNFLRRIDPDGSVVPFARNALSPGEFAGLCFSPDGRTLFVNLQHDGSRLRSAARSSELARTASGDRHAAAARAGRPARGPRRAGLCPLRARPSRSERRLNVCAGIA